MYIILGLIVELTTFFGTNIIIFKAALDCVLKIPEEGYKIDKTALDEYKKNHEKDKEGIFNQIIGYLILLFPGINLLYAHIKSIRMKKLMMDDVEVKKLLIPMTEDEKKQYAELENLEQKLLFTISLSASENEVIKDDESTLLNYNELFPLAYTLEDVKKLNNVTNCSYSIGKIDGRNIAIIGIPTSDISINQIRLKKEDFKIIHSYEIMNEEDAKNKTFLVYPFTNINDEAIQNTIDEIIESRRSKKQNEKIYRNNFLEDTKLESYNNKKFVLKKPGF
jgi:hypothetical protein